MCNDKRIYMCVCMLSHFSWVWLFATVWTLACQAPLSMGFFRQEYWSGLPGTLARDLPKQGFKLTFLTSTCIGRWVLYHWCHLGSPGIYIRGYYTHQYICTQCKSTQIHEINSNRHKRRNWCPAHIHWQILETENH